MAGPQNPVTEKREQKKRCNVCARKSLSQDAAGRLRERSRMCQVLSERKREGREREQERERGELQGR